MVYREPITAENVLNHPKRARIYDLIMGSPGIRHRDLYKKATGISSGSFDGHIHNLLKTGLITKVTEIVNVHGLVRKVTETTTKYYPVQKEAPKLPELKTGYRSIGDIFAEALAEMGPKRTATPIEVVTGDKNYSQPQTA